MEYLKPTDDLKYLEQLTACVKTPDWLTDRRVENIGLAGDDPKWIDYATRKGPFVSKSYLI